MMSLDWHRKKEDAEDRQPLATIPNCVMLVVFKILANTRERRNTVSNIVNFPLKTECGSEFGSWCFGSYSWLLAEVGMEMRSPDFLPVYHTLLS